MPTYNYKSRELIAKIVYYGPGRCGKTTNLQQIHAKMRPETRSDLLSVATETDRTIYFDLLPLNLGTISGMKFMVRLFTVPGQVYYSETRKLVLKGADGVVFVADSQDHMLDENRQSLRDLKENLRANGIDYDSVPLVMQWNKRDLPQLVSEAELDATLNDRGANAISAVAANGQGVLETLRHATLGVFNHIKSGGKTSAVPPGAGRARSRSEAPRPSSSSLTPRPPGQAAARPARTASEARAPGNRGPHADARSVGPHADARSVGPHADARSVGPHEDARSVGPHADARSVGPHADALSVGPHADALSVGPHEDALGPKVSPRGWSASLPKANLPGAGADRSRASNATPPREAPGPMKISTEMVLDEFKNLAVIQSQLSERVTQLETEVERLARENHEMRELLARRS